ncbi:MAG: cobalamin B12-binding domain-containing protein [Candidatus Promineofilum sp.]|nr:cobalamin B12-binding domain-containing protein [Promineifilum sp.]
MSVQQEHLTSALAMRRLDSLLAATRRRGSGRIIGCPPGESHTFSPMMVTLLLRRRGWDVIYLGADVPTNRLQATIDRTQPDLVVFSAHLLDTAASLLDTAYYLRHRSLVGLRRLRLRHFARLRRRIPGHFLGLRSAARRLSSSRTSFSIAPSAPPVRPVPEAYQQPGPTSASALDSSRPTSGMRWPHRRAISGR